LLTALDVNFTAKFLPYVGLGALFFLLVAGLNALLLRMGGALAHLLAFGVVFLGTLSDLSFTWSGSTLAAGGAGDIRPITYALCAMLFSVVIASQFARR